MLIGVEGAASTYIDKTMVQITLKQGERAGYKMGRPDCPVHVSITRSAQLGEAAPRKAAVP